MKVDNSVNLSLLNRTLDGLWLRQQTTMENIANYSTPGYKSKTVDFESMLSSNLKNIYGKMSFDVNEKIESSKIIIEENDNLSMRLDGNNVDLEKENLQLAKTQFQYLYTITEINSYFSKLQSVISEGKK